MATTSELPDLVNVLTHPQSIRAHDTFTRLLADAQFAVTKYPEHLYPDEKHRKKIYSNKFVHLRAERDKHVVLARFDSADKVNPLERAHPWGQTPVPVSYFMTALGAILQATALEEEKEKRVTSLLFAYSLRPEHAHELSQHLGSTILLLDDHECIRDRVASVPFYQSMSFIESLRW